MAISANTLFHFTKYEFLKSIIERKCFFPRLCFEFYICKDDFIVAYPMVCFCDIPLSNIYEHAKEYNCNGIGLKKEWGKKNKINPVFYIQKDSYAYDLMFSLLFENKYIMNEDKVFISMMGDISCKKLMFTNILSSFIKPVKGKIWEKENQDFKICKLTKEYIERNFYNEREWRYIPQTIKEISNFENIVPVNYIPINHFIKDGKFSKDIFDKRNKEIEDSHQLHYSIDDIKYIIIERDDLKIDFEKFVNTLNNYNIEEKNILMSKVNTLNQVKEDY